MRWCWRLSESVAALSVPAFLAWIHAPPQQLVTWEGAEASLHWGSKPSLAAATSLLSQPETAGQQHAAPNLLKAAEGAQIAAKVSESAYDVRLKMDWDNLVFPAALQLAQLTDNDQYHHILQSNYLAQWLCTQAGTVAFTNKVSRRREQAGVRVSILGCTGGSCKMMSANSAVQHIC